MKKTIIIGEDNFENLINQDGYYVDKTRIIEDILDSKGGVKLFPRPRRFGKTLLMSMLNNFFDIDKKEANKEVTPKRRHHNKSNVAKLKLLVTVVNKSKVLFYLHLLEEYEIKSASNIFYKKSSTMEQDEIKQYLLKKGYKNENINRAIENI